MLHCKDIVWANYPFTDGTAGKVRPAVIIVSKNSYGDVICLPITRTMTSNSFKLNSTHIEGKADMALLKLLTVAYVSLEQPMTLELSNIRTSDPILARLNDSAMQVIMAQLMQQMECK